MPPTNAWGENPVTLEQLLQIDIIVFAMCAQVRLTQDPRGWRADYADKELGHVVGFGHRPTVALGQCYRRVCEARDLKAASMAEDEFKAWKATRPSGL